MELLILFAIGGFVVVLLCVSVYYFDALQDVTKGWTSDAGDDAEDEAGDIGTFHFDIPDSLRDVIGTYGGVPIHRHADIGGAPYEFAYIYCQSTRMVLQADARCIAPGLVYFPAHPAVTTSK